MQVSLKTVEEIGSGVACMSGPWPAGLLPAQPEGKGPHPCLLWLLLLGKSSMEVGGQMAWPHLGHLWPGSQGASEVDLWC